MNDEAKKTIESSISECESHIKWIERARAALTSTFPLDQDAVTSLPDRSVELVDQLIYRFTKLQDSMAHRLVPSLYSYLEASDGSIPFMDILSRLEQLGVLRDQRVWQEFRDLRNSLAHDYPESAAQTALTRNKLHDRLPALVEVYADLKAAYLSRAGRTPDDRTPN